MGRTWGIPPALLCLRRARRGRPRSRPREACWGREAGVSRERRPPGWPSPRGQASELVRTPLCECEEREGHLPPRLVVWERWPRPGRRFPRTRAGLGLRSPWLGARDSAASAGPSAPGTACGVRKGPTGPWLLRRPWDPSFHVDRPSRWSLGPAVDALRCEHGARRVCGAVCAWRFPGYIRYVHGAWCQVTWAWDLVCLCCIRYAHDTGVSTVPRFMWCGQGARCARGTCVTYGL